MKEKIKTMMSFLLLTPFFIMMLAYAISIKISGWDFSGVGK